MNSSKWSMSVEPGAVDSWADNSQVSIAMSDYPKNDEKKPQNSYTLRERLGLDELFSGDVLRGAIAELIGSSILVFMCDTIVISTVESNISMPNLVLAILMGLTIGTVIMALYPISGGHVNPVITLPATLVGLISLSRAFMYILAQCVGSALGALALKAVVSNEVADKFSLGGCTITVVVSGENGPIVVGIGIVQAFWLETFCTFALLVIALGIAFNPGLMKSLGLVVVCLIIGVVATILIYVSTTVTGQKGYAGAGMNPARCFGAALIRGGHLWNGHWVFWAGPTFACFAFYFFTKVVCDEEFQSRGDKYDFIEIIKALIRG